MKKAQIASGKHIKVPSNDMEKVANLIRKVEDDRLVESKEALKAFQNKDRSFILKSKSAADSDSESIPKKTLDGPAILIKKKGDGPTITKERDVSGTLDGGDYLDMSLLV